MDNRKQVFSNMAWRFAERIGAQGVKLIVEIVLARLLFPKDYGLIALVTVFIKVLNVFVDSGLGNALIQKKNADSLDFSSVFWFNIVWCCIIYSLLYISAPLIAAFYNKPIYNITEIVSVIRVLGIQLIVSGVKNVQQAYVSRNLLFRKFFFSTLAGTIGAAGIGIFIAYKGLGVWALVAQHLFNVLLDTIILWITVRWRPKLQFSFKRLWGLVSFGWKLLVSMLIDTIYNEIRQLMIGKIYSSSDLAYYNRGQQFPELFVNNVNNAMDSVLLPTMSKEQDDRNRVRAMTRRAIKTSVYIMAPLMIGLAVIGEPFVRVVLTEKWIPCVPFMQIFCVSFMFQPIHTANLNAIKALGRSDLFLKLEIAKKVVGFTVLLLVMNHGVMAIAYSLLLTSFTSQVINAWPNKKLLGYSYINQLQDIAPSIFLSLFMGAVVYCVQFIPFPDMLVLVIQISVGAIIYILGSIIFKIDSFAYVKGLIKSYIRKKQ